MKDRIIKKLVIKTPYITKSGKIKEKRRIIKSCKQCYLCKQMPYLEDAEFYCYKNNRIIDNPEQISLECPELKK